MKKARRIYLLLGLFIVGFAALSAVSAAAEEPKPKAAKRAKQPQPAAQAEIQPMRVIVTGELLKEEPAPHTARGSDLSALDATGTPRRADEPRFVTGSLNRQQFELYGNAATTASNLRIYGRNDFRNGGILGGPFGASAAEMQARITQERYVLDLRTVPAARRLDAATRLLGPERGRQLVAEFNRWQATHP